jgi:hypothetical protein
MPELKKLDLNSSPATPSPTTPSPQPAKVAQSASTSPSIATPPATSQKSSKIAIIVAVAIVLGVGSGYALDQFLPGQTSQFATTTSPSTASSSKVKVGDVAGAEDEAAFPDKAEGVLEKGGLDGEGSHKLLRAGGPSKTAYLTSSVVDLDEYVGHKVEVSGETFAGQKAGWLMDVGHLKVLELNASQPE